MKAFDHSAFEKITTFIFDVDGVFTNCDVLIMEDGTLLRAMTVRDGLALRLAKEAGYRLAVITKGASLGVSNRLQSLGVEDFYDKLVEKIGAIEELISKHGLNKEEMLYMGDDLPDLDVFPYVSISTCPKDAAHEVLEAADYVSPIKGGQGCVREIIERVMRIQGKWKY